MMNSDLREMLSDLLGRVDGIDAPEETKRKLKRFIEDTFEDVNQAHGHEWLDEVWATDALSYEVPNKE